MVTAFDASTTMSLTYRKPVKSMLESCCSKHMSNNRARFSDSIECKGVVKPGINDVIPSYGVDAVRMATVVDGVKHYITINGVMHTPK